MSDEIKPIDFPADLATGWEHQRCANRISELQAKCDRQARAIEVLVDALKEAQTQIHGHWCVSEYNYIEGYHHWPCSDIQKAREDARRILDGKPTDDEINQGLDEMF